MSKKKKTTSSAGRKIAPRVIRPIEVRPSKPSIPPNPSLRLYRRIAGGFIGVVVVLLLVVVVLSTTKAVIRVTPLPRETDVVFLVDVVKENAAAGAILGNVVEQTFEQTKAFPVLAGEKKEVLDKSGGEVIIVNNSSHTQPLVATTRLLSSGGVLFRLDKGVTVPAGGSVTAVIHADQTGPAGDIGPDKFIIPGLATSLQAEIYGESSVAMTGGKKMVSAVTQEELDADAVQLADEVLTAAKEQLQTVGKGNWTGEVFVSDIAEQTSDTKDGEEKDSVTLSVKMTVTGVFYDAVAYNKLASAKLYENLPDGFVFTNVAHEMDYGLAVSDVGSASTTLRAELKEEAIVSNTNSFLQPEVLAGKTPEEVKSYLISAGLASDVSVWIFPPWNRKVPSMVDHVTVQVVE